MNYSLIAFIVIALGCGAVLGWQMRKLVARFEHMEEVIQRRRLPYPTLAALEDITALSDMAAFENADTDKVLETVLTMLLRSERARKHSELFVMQIEEIAKLVRTRPHEYDAAKPMSER